MFHINLNFLTINLGRWRMVLDSRRSKLGAEDAPARDYVVRLARLARCGANELLHCRASSYQALLLLSWRRCFVDLVMLNVELMSNRLNDQALLGNLRCRAWCPSCHRYIFNARGTYRILNERHTMLVVMMIIWVKLLLLIIWMSGWMDLIGVQNMLRIVQKWASSWNHIQILGLATLLIRWHRPWKATERVTVGLFMLYISRFELNVLRV